MNGKATCAILKQIRRDIAEKNDIALTIEECTYQGSCSGTCLAVPEETFSLLLPEKDAPPFVSEWIVDVKDMDPVRYERYTALSPDRMRKNLSTLAARCPELVTVRVPLIPGINTPENCARSERILREMGFSRIDRFAYIIPKTK